MLPNDQVNQGVQMGTGVDWNLIQQEIQYKFTGQGEAPWCQGNKAIPLLKTETVHYRDLIAAAAQNFGDAVFAAVEQFWHRKFHQSIQYGHCFRSCELPYLVKASGYDLGTTVFYAREKLRPLEVQELKWFMRFYFADRQIELMPQDFEVVCSLDRDQPEWFCYVVRFAK